MATVQEQIDHVRENWLITVIFIVLLLIAWEGR